MRRSTYLLANYGTRFSPESLTAQRNVPSMLQGYLTFLKMHLRRARHRNISRIAYATGFKRDWQRVYINLRVRELAAEGIEIGPQHAKEFEEVEDLTLREFLKDKMRAAHGKILQQVEQGCRAVKEDRLDDHLGFGMELRESELPPDERTFKHQQGVFVKSGTVPVGTVVGIVPGMAWHGVNKLARTWDKDSDGNPNFVSPHVHHRRAEIDNAVLDSDMKRYKAFFGERNATQAELSRAESEYAQKIEEYMRFYRGTGKDLVSIFKRTWYPIWRWLCFRGPIGRGQLPYLPPREWAKRNAFQTVLGKRWDHPFAKGNYVNHVGVHGDPNVAFIPVSIPTVFPADLLPYLPIQMDAAQKLGNTGIAGAMRARDKEQGPTITMNYLVWGKPYAGEATALETQFLVMVPAIVAISLREIHEGEEFLANHRFCPHWDVKPDYPSWYRPVPHLAVEDSLASNLDPPGLGLFTKWTLGCVDPHVSFMEAVRDPRYVNYTVPKKLTRLLKRLF